MTSLPGLPEIESGTFCKQESRCSNAELWARPQLCPWWEGLASGDLLQWTFCLEAISLLRECASPTQCFHFSFSCLIMLKIKWKAPVWKARFPNCSEGRWWYVFDWPENAGDGTFDLVLGCLTPMFLLAVLYPVQARGLSVWTDRGLLWHPTKYKRKEKQ